jgi:hypothetical protein
MAQNETSVSGDVVWQDGDDLSETNLTRTAAKNNLTDYVERGLGFVADFGSNTLDIGSGHVIIQDGINAYDLFPDSVNDLSLPAGSGVNYVFAAHDPNTDDDITYHIDDDDTPPTNPSLKIGTVDTANDTSTNINRNPVGNFRTVSINGTTVLESDGVIASGALPDLAITETYVVADKTERLSLNVEEGDLAIQQDVDETYIFTGGDPSNDSDWSEIVTSPAQHAASHEKGGSDEITTFGDTTHDSVSTATIVDPDTSTTYDVGDDLVGGLSISEGDAISVFDDSIDPSNLSSPTYNTVVDFSTSRDVIGGSLSHSNISSIRVTWGSGNTVEFGTSSQNNFGLTSADSRFVSIPLPQLNSVSKIEAFVNNGGNDLGYFIYTK